MLEQIDYLLLLPKIYLRVKEVNEGMKVMRIAFLIVAMLVPMTALSVSADTGTVTTDQSIFQIIDFNGKVGNHAFDSTSEFADILNEPVLSGTVIEGSCSLKLKPERAEYRQFLQLGTGLFDTEWRVTPDNLESPLIWHNFSNETFLWPPPMHSTAEFTVVFSGIVPQPVQKDYVTLGNGDRAEATLIKEISVNILNIQVRKSLADFSYENDPASWTKDSISVVNVISAAGTATNEMIIAAKNRIGDMHKELLLLTDPEGATQLQIAKMPSIVGQSFTTMINREAQLGQLGNATLNSGYPFLASEIGQQVGSMAGATADASRAVSNEIAPTSKASSWPYIVLICVFAVLAIASLLWSLRRRKVIADEVKDGLELYRGRTVDSSVMEDMYRRIRGGS